jgi:hypothetical protein
MFSEVGYTQGMSFIAAMVLMVFDQTPQDDVLALVVFIKVMTDERSYWWKMYCDGTPKLFSFTQVIRDHLKSKHPKVFRTLNEHNVILESLLASPLLTMFSNLIPLNDALIVLERFMLDGEKAIRDIFVHLFKLYESEIVGMDCWDIQVYLSRSMYQ